MSKPTYQQVHTDVPLTNISIAYRNLAFIADQVFPNIPVNNITGKYFTYTKADWLRREAAVRAPGARAARGDYGLSSALYTCVEYAIAKGVADEIVDNADAPLKPLEDATAWATQQLLLQRESDVASTIFTAGAWSGSSTPSPLWSDQTSDPINDVETATNGVVSTIGVEANTGVVGRGVWRYLKQHPDIVDRIKYAAGPNSPAVVSLNAIAALFGLNKFLVGASIEDTAQEGATSSLSYLWGSHMFVAYVAANASLLEPSAGYIFNYKQREVSRFREDQERQDIVEVRSSWDAVLTASDAGYWLKSVV